MEIIKLDSAVDIVFKGRIPTYARLHNKKGNIVKVVKTDFVLNNMFEAKYDFAFKRGEVYNVICHHDTEKGIHVFENNKEFTEM